MDYQVGKLYRVTRSVYHNSHNGVAVLLAGGHAMYVERKAHYTANMMNSQEEGWVENHWDYVFLNSAGEIVHMCDRGQLDELFEGPL